MRRQFQNIVLLIALSAVASGEEPPSADSQSATSTSEGIGATLERRASLRDQFDARFTPEWIKAWDLKRDAFLKKAGLNFSLAYDSLALVALGGGEQPVGASGELSLIGDWTFAGENRGRPLDLHFRLRSRHAYGNRPPAALAGDIGALWGVTDGFTDKGFEIPDFYLKQRFLRRDLELRIGQLGIDNQFDAHALRSAKQAFLNRAFSSNPAVPFPRFGAGATLKWKPENGFDLTVGATTIQATTSGDQVDLNFGSSDLFQALQLGYDFDGRHGDPARVQLMLWHSDAVEDEGLPDGSGAAFTLEQEFKDSQTRAFFRYAWADGESADIAHFVAGGIGRTCRGFDLLGVALGAGQSAGPDDDWQAVFETFYRWQVAAELHITPSVQVLVGDGFAGGGDLRIIPGLRGQFSF